MKGSAARDRYLPMTESAFYILVSCVESRHGYGIMQHVEGLTDGRVTLAPGTLYGTLSKMEKDRLIGLASVEETRKIYQITSLGAEILDEEITRIRELYRNTKGIEL